MAIGWNGLLINTRPNASDLDGIAPIDSFGGIVGTVGRIRIGSPPLAEGSELVGSGLCFFDADDFSTASFSFFLTVGVGLGGKLSAGPPFGFMPLVFRRRSYLLALTRH